MAQGGPRASRAVIGIVGSSGVGKTTLLERLLPSLEARGFAVGAAKHASHGFLADRPGKDSHRLYEAGARAVALISSEQVATFRRLEGSPPRGPALAEALAALPADLDIVLAEGFAWEPVPRFILVGPDEAARSEHLECGEVLGIVPMPPPLDAKPFISDATVEALADRIVETSNAMRGGCAVGADPQGAREA
jgi:molybdopterin-guanine dinucleotide biosynthesis protein B